MDADVGNTLAVHGNGVHGAGGGAFAALDAEFLLLDDAAALALLEAARGTGRRAWGGVAGKTQFGRESGGQSPGGQNADAGIFPGQAFMDHAGAGQGTGMTPYAPLHTACDELFHDFFSVSWLPKKT